MQEPFLENFGDQRSVKSILLGRSLHSGGSKEQFRKIAKIEVCKDLKLPPFTSEGCVWWDATAKLSFSLWFCSKFFVSNSCQCKSEHSLQCNFAASFFAVDSFQSFVLSKL